MQLTREISQYDVKGLFGGLLQPFLGMGNQVLEKVQFQLLITNQQLYNKKYIKFMTMTTLISI